MDKIITIKIHVDDNVWKKKTELDNEDDFVAIITDGISDYLMDSDCGIQEVEFL